MEESRTWHTNLLLVGTREDVHPLILLDRVCDAHGLGDDVDAAQDAAAGGGGEGEDFEEEGVVGC